MCVCVLGHLRTQWRVRRGSRKRQVREEQGQGSAGHTGGGRVSQGARPVLQGRAGGKRETWRQRCAGAGLHLGSWLLVSLHNSHEELETSHGASIRTTDIGKHSKSRSYIPAQRASW